jgi:hypothetical protein
VTPSTAGSASQKLAPTRATANPAPRAPATTVDASCAVGTRTPREAGVGPSQGSDPGREGERTMPNGLSMPRRGPSAVVPAPVVRTGLDDATGRPLTYGPLPYTGRRRRPGAASRRRSERQEATWWDGCQERRGRSRGEGRSRPAALRAEVPARGGRPAAAAPRDGAGPDPHARGTAARDQGPAAGGPGAERQARRDPAQRPRAAREPQGGGRAARRPPQTYGTFLGASDDGHRHGDGRPGASSRSTSPPRSSSTTSSPGSRSGSTRR